ncbi:sugar-binding protein [Alteromonas pelagimontana]|uniref:Sugar-binding protein n=1 Tax=Alteromonas pelagimontana TaxID=1858656 RepID=A0A6M4MBR9_9ALTE|nr:sugar-binding protein [Alteromonas pelagimontana]QJR80641.1 sugar-binding protein [Alteromonas pelagimontana]
MILQKKLLSSLAMLSCLSASAQAENAIFSASPVTIDGKGNEAVWAKAEWHPIDQLMVGEKPTPQDFSGRYKAAWDQGQLYLLVEIVDDKLEDTHPNPKVQYWDDDTLEIFLDEDTSGGNHLHSYNAFAYHVALDGNVADFGNNTSEKEQVVLLNDHVKSVWTRSDEAPFPLTWEVAIKVYPDSYSMSKPGKPVVLSENKTLGFMVAYCDNDGSAEREHFVGSHAIEPVNGDMNRGYIDASVFGKLTLVKP